MIRCCRVYATLTRRRSFGVEYLCGCHVIVHTVGDTWKGVGDVTVLSISQNWMLIRENKMPRFGPGGESKQRSPLVCLPQRTPPFQFSIFCCHLCEKVPRMKILFYFMGEFAQMLFEFLRYYILL